MAEGKEKSDECVKVVVRCRPMSSREIDDKRTSIVEVDRDVSAIRVHKPSDVGGASNEPPKSFTFDFVYPPNTAQIHLFNETAKPIVDSVLAGYNGTIFAYGQTGTGKTHTMEGVIDNVDLKGIMPNSFDYVFNAVKGAAKNVEFLVRASFLEIYLDEVYDLLNQKDARQRMDVKEDPQRGVFVKDLCTDTVKSPSDLHALLEIGTRQRKVGATEMNKGSSRSHSIFSIVVETSTTDEHGVRTYKQGKLNLVDLAGSERQKKTHASGDRLDEAKAINLSLSALGNVIKALVSRNKQHVPFRDSKLTRLLQDSLGGNTKTVMVANVGPANHNFEETISTLRYADRAKQIKNKPKVNEDAKDAMLRQMQEEIAMLKARLVAKQRGIDFSKLSHDQAVVLGLNGTLPDGTSASSLSADVEEMEIIKEKIVDSGFRMEDLQRVITQAKKEEAEMENKTEAEKQEIVRRKQEAEEKYRDLDAELKKHEAHVELEKSEMAQCEHMLREKQQELLKGGGDLAFAAQQKQELKKTEEELWKRREEQERLAKELAAKEDAKLLLDEEYQNAQEELTQIQKKLKLLFVRWQEKKEDLKLLQEEFDMEREDLVDTIRALDKQMKLKALVVDTFLPPEVVSQLDSLKHWDSFNDQWTLPGLQFAGNTIPRLDAQSIPGFGLFGLGLGGGLNGGSGGMAGQGFDTSSFHPEMTSEMRARLARRMLQPGEPPLAEEVYYNYGMDGQVNRKKPKSVKRRG